MKKRYSLKRKSRFLLFVFIITLLTSTFIYTAAVYGFKETSYQMVEISRGDTLWDIAKQYSQEQDIREFVYQIRMANNMASSEIYAGTVIRVPIYK